MRENKMSLIAGVIYIFFAIFIFFHTIFIIKLNKRRKIIENLMSLMNEELKKLMEDKI
jgi:hypothetical protein